MNYEMFLDSKKLRLNSVGLQIEESYYKQAVLNMVEAERLSKAPKQITFSDLTDIHLS